METHTMNLKKINKLLFWFGLRHIPLLFICRPKVIVFNESSMQIKLKLNWLSKNHLNSMYFGALSIGADISGGLAAFYFIKKNNYPISLIFKDFHAKFLKRAETDVIFVCNQIKEIKQFIEKTNTSADRQHMTVIINAYPKNEINHDAVAEFKLTLSVKKTT